MEHYQAQHRTQRHAGEYGGSNLGNAGGAWAEPTSWQGQPHSLTLTLPPLAVLVLKPS